MKQPTNYKGMTQQAPHPRGQTVAISTSMSHLKVMSKHTKQLSYIWTNNLLYLDM